MSSTPITPQQCLSSPVKSNQTNFSSVSNKRVNPPKSDSAESSSESSLSRSSKLTKWNEAPCLDYSNTELKQQQASLQKATTTSTTAHQSNTTPLQQPRRSKRLKLKAQQRIRQKTNSVDIQPKRDYHQITLTAPNQPTLSSPATTQSLILEPVPLPPPQQTQPSPKSSCPPQPTAQLVDLSPVLNRCATWSAKATPMHSSLRRQHPVLSSLTPATGRRVRWGRVECRKFEQRCGIMSSAVPSESGPSLHLGKLLSETSTHLEDYESGKNGQMNCSELDKKERIARVKQFSLEDVKKSQLKLDAAEIKELNHSRTETGCRCTSIYRMRKVELIHRIVYLRCAVTNGECDKKVERRALKKMKKPELFDKLRRVQFEMYGRYDVCCVDEDCYCVREGIECQIDGDCCTCGGTDVYHNQIDEEEEKEVRKTAGKKRKGNPKKDSLCCANPNGNTLKVNVLDFVSGEGAVGEHDVVKDAVVEIPSFDSPYVRKRIFEWMDHYQDVETTHSDKENDLSDETDEDEVIELASGAVKTLQF